MERILSGRSGVYHLHLCRIHYWFCPDVGVRVLNPWMILGIAVMWAISLFGVGKWQNKAGAEHERVTWQAKEIEQVNAANAAIKRLSDEARAKEKESVDTMTRLATQLLKERATNEARRKADAAAVRAGDLRLRIPASVCAGGDFTGPPRPASSGGDGSASVELPRAIAGDLLDLANDADQVADQLRACQSVIIADRKDSP